MKVQSLNKRLTQAIVAAVFAAMITVMTAFVCHIPYAVGGGYIHLGDSLIYLSAALLPPPFAIFAAAVGSGLADLMTAPVWTVFTVIIKALLVLPFSCKKARIICRRNIAAMGIAALITIVGYYIAEWIIFGNATAPVLSVPGNVIQAAASAGIFLLLGMALDKTGLKNKINVE